MTVGVKISREENPNYKTRVRRQNLINGQWVDEEVNEFTTFELTAEQPVQQYIHSTQRLVVEEYKPQEA